MEDNKDATIYEQRAADILRGNKKVYTKEHGSSSISSILRAPYIYYEKLILENVLPHFKILELASGTGQFTNKLLESGSGVTCIDISPSSLEVLKQRYNSPFNLKAQCSDMHNLPFDDNSFDLVASAGGMSYASNSQLRREIYRVLKNKGYFICVDSLNHNPIYWLNRFLQFLMGKRSFSTIKRMPTMKLLEAYKNKFDNINIRYFGSISWAYKILKPFISKSLFMRLSDSFDHINLFNTLAFKIVFICQKLD